MAVFENEDGWGLRWIGSGRRVVWLCRSCLCGIGRSRGVRRSGVGWRNVGVASRTASVEDSRASLVVGGVIFLILIGIVHIHGIGDGQSVNVGVVSLSVHRPVMVMTAVMGKLIMEIDACVGRSKAGRRETVTSK